MQRDEAEQSAADAAAAAEPTSAYMLSYYAAQHIGSVLVVSGISLLCFGYDKEWMHNTHLCMLCMAVCLVGLIFHELRPFKVSYLMTLIELVILQHFIEHVLQKALQTVQVVNCLCCWHASLLISMLPEHPHFL